MPIRKILTGLFLVQILFSGCSSTEVFKKPNTPWPFNGRIVNLSARSLRGLVVESNKVVVLPPGGKSAWYMDVDFVEDPVSGDWYKIGAKRCVYNGDDKSSFGKFRLVDQTSIRRLLADAEQ